MIRLVFERDQPPWVWYSRLDKRSNYWAFGPVGVPFNRRRPFHWLIALLALANHGRRP